MITSTGNTQIKNVMQLNQKAKARREQGLFAAEGIKMFLEAGRLDFRIYVSESLSKDARVMERARQFPF